MVIAKSTNVFTLNNSFKSNMLNQISRSPTPCGLTPKVGQHWASFKGYHVGNNHKPVVFYTRRKDTTQKQEKKTKLENKQWWIVVTIALVLKAKALMSCLFDVISFTRSLNDSGETPTIPFLISSSLFASINALISSSLSCIIVTPPHTTNRQKSQSQSQTEFILYP